MSTRAELYAIYKPLHDAGLSASAIARRLGKPYTTVANVLADPDGSKQRQRRKRYQGACLVCGKPTDGSNGRRRAPRYCAEHFVGSPDHQAQAAAQTKWTRELIVTRIREWAGIYGEPPAIPDWNPYSAREINDEQRALRFEAAQHYWPWFTSVVLRFGSWNAAIEAAGFTPREGTGAGGNSDRHRHESAGEVRLRRRVNAVRPLLDDGVTLTSIAEHLWSHWGYASATSAYSVLSGAGARRPGGHRWNGRPATRYEIARLREIP